MTDSIRVLEMLDSRLCGRDGWFEAVLSRLVLKIAAFRDLIRV